MKERSGRSLDLLAAARKGAGQGLAGDPHVWLDPVRYAAMVRSIGAALGNEPAADRLARRLGRLDARVSAAASRTARAGRS